MARMVGVIRDLMAAEGDTPAPARGGKRDAATGKPPRRKRKEWRPMMVAPLPPFRPGSR
jgi:hypothetical protein